MVSYFLPESNQAQEAYHCPISLRQGSPELPHNTGKRRVTLPLVPLGTVRGVAHDASFSWTFPGIVSAVVLGWQFDAAASPTAILCAEAVRWGCHRQLIADALVARGWKIGHVLRPARVLPHQLTECGTAGEEASKEQPNCLKNAHSRTSSTEPNSRIVRPMWLHGKRRKSFARTADGVFGRDSDTGETGIVRVDPCATGRKR